METPKFLYRLVRGYIITEFVDIIKNAMVGTSQNLKILLQKSKPPLSGFLIVLKTI